MGRLRWSPRIFLLLLLIPVAIVVGAPRASRRSVKPAGTPAPAATRAKDDGKDLRAQVAKLREEILRAKEREADLERSLEAMGKELKALRTRFESFSEWSLQEMLSLSMAVRSAARSSGRGRASAYASDDESAEPLPISTDSQPPWLGGTTVAREYFRARMREAMRDEMRSRWQRRSERMLSRSLDLLKETLGLTQEQAEQLKPLLEQRSKKMNELRQKRFTEEMNREDFRGAMKNINDAFIAEASPLLDGEQVKKLTASQDEILRGMRGGPRGRFGGGPPGGGGFGPPGGPMGGR